MADAYFQLCFVDANKPIFSRTILSCPELENSIGTGSFNWSRAVSALCLLVTATKLDLDLIENFDMRKETIWGRRAGFMEFAES